MKTIQEENLIIIRLYPNERIIDCLIDACKKYHIQTAIVLSGIGQIKQISIGYFKEKGNYMPETFPTPHELLQLSGTIISHDDTHIPHLHVLLGDEHKQVIGGHLIDGIVEITNEIILMTSKIHLERKHSVITGLYELIIPDET
jgi:predicted DNA-binding protein with PD1-like motif